MRDYGQFCPIAKASEVFAQRWTPLILRELLMGSTRFNELERGLPKISRSMLLQRLRSLEDTGILSREFDTVTHSPRYQLTQAGTELFDVVKGLGDWGHKWINHDVEPQDLDPDLLMWDMHRRIHLDLLPDRRVVARFDFYGTHHKSYWLVLERPIPSVCYQDPGFDVDVFVTGDTVTMHRIWLGRQTMSTAIKQGFVEMRGPRDLVRDLPGWLALSIFAEIPSAV